MVKTILELDLVGYSRIAKLLEELGSAAEVAGLNRQIQEFVDRGLAAVGARRADAVAATTGDGAILVLDAPEHAHHVARTVHAAGEHNAGRTEPVTKRHFRTGAATGNIDIRPRETGGIDIAGVTIANAVRLEAAARPGELLIEAATYAGLPDRLKLEYTTEEIVPGKRDEVFRAHRCALCPPPAAPAPAPAKVNPTTIDRRALLGFLEKLYPQDRLARLIFLLGMPIGDQPSVRQTHNARVMEVVNWATSPVGPGLAALESEVRFVCEKAGE